ncbi:MAG: Rpn family recombination-promoting nuclease/putative transposase, partial [Myxococcales bacterium]|nr:Rpn family recombination-promoting nuclease/putative transposase [Myxococcales bacterium]
MASPHDQFFRTLFGQPRLAASLLRGLLPAGLVTGLDLDRLIVRDGEFPAIGRGGRRADLVCEVPWRDGPAAPAHVVVLCEHQSRRDRWMALRLSEYAHGVWAAWRQAHPRTKHVPLVLPVVVYNGDSPWRAPPGLLDLQSGPQKFKQAARPGVFDGHFLLDDLPSTVDAALRARAMEAAAELGLRLLRDARGDLAAGVRAAKALFARIDESPSGLAALGAVIRYCLVADDGTVERVLVEEIAPTLEPEPQEILMSSADRLRAEGRAEGLKQGLEQGLEQ